jgi:hypothetical protein
VLLAGRLSTEGGGIPVDRLVAVFGDIALTSVISRFAVAEDSRIRTPFEGVLRENRVSMETVSISVHKYLPRNGSLVSPWSGNVESTSRVKPTIPLPLGRDIR